MIGKKRVRFENKRVDFIDPGIRTKGYSDIRVLNIPPAAVIRTELVVLRKKTVPDLLAMYEKWYPGTFWVLFNASYFNTKTGELAGKAINRGRVIAHDVAGKTESRPHLYRKDGRFSIGRVDKPDGIEWAVNIVPSLTKSGHIAYPVAAEKIPSDVPGANPRILFGVTQAGSLGIVTVDGRGATDAGLSAEGCAYLMQYLGYGTSASGDGGGSASLASNCRELLNKLNINTQRKYHVADMSAHQRPRVVHHAIAIQIDPRRLGL